MSTIERLAAAPVVEATREALRDADSAWIVGGAVRDAILEREVSDLDLAVAGDPGAAARAIGQAIGEHAFELSAEFGTWRVATSGRGWQIDITALRGGGIEGDLAARDFTIGAVAVPLTGGEPIDPYGGLRDLEEKRLRAVGETSFSDDPVFYEPLAWRRRWTWRSSRARWRRREPPPRAQPTRLASANWRSCGS
jgi:poly(A) polymerase